MPNCESNNVLMNNAYKKIAQTLLVLFTEFNSQNESLVTILNDYSTDINGRKEGLISELDTYIIKRSECCYNFVLRINEIIELFSEIPCVVPIENTTTTSEHTTTVEEITTTLDETICNIPTVVNIKGSYYPYTIDKFLGAVTGVVSITVNSFDMPDRFVVEFDGNTVIDTGYLGNPLFQTYLDAACFLEGDTAGDISSVTTATFYFNKDTATDHATISVYSPLNNSRFEFTVSCPDEEAQCLDIALDILEIDFVVTTTTAEETTTTVELPIECAIYSITGEAMNGVTVTGLLCDGNPYSQPLNMNETVITPCLTKGSLSNLYVTIVELYGCDVTTTEEITTTESIDCELDGIIECDITTTEEPTTTIL
jgi:hypothetical protein